MRVEIIIDKEQKINQAILVAFEKELYRNLCQHFPETAIRIRQGSISHIELSGIRLDDDKQRVMNTIQQVWEDDYWLN